MASFICRNRVLWNKFTLHYALALVFFKKDFQPPESKKMMLSCLPRALARRVSKNSRKFRFRSWIASVNQKEPPSITGKIIWHLIFRNWISCQTRKLRKLHRYLHWHVLFDFDTTLFLARVCGLFARENSKLTKYHPFKVALIFLLFWH